MIRSKRPGLSFCNPCAPPEPGIVGEKRPNNNEQKRDDGGTVGGAVEEVFSVVDVVGDEADDEEDDSVVGAVLYASAQPKLNDRKQIEREAMWWMQEFDPDQDLTNPDVEEILDDIFRVLDDNDYYSPSDDFIEKHTQKMVKRLNDQKLEEAAQKLRFQRTHHVVCNMGQTWGNGTIQAVNVPDPQEPWNKLPYVIKLNHPVNQLISAPQDDNHTVLREVCFGQGQDGLMFTVICLPMQHKPGPRRFRVGERVACVVEDSVPDPTGSVWTAGTVQEIDVDMEEGVKLHLIQLLGRDWPFGVTCAPYRVQLDNGCCVLVHKDEHWLIRDLAYQPVGPCQKMDGRSNIVKQQCGDAYVVVDHTTRQVRKCDPE